MTELQIIDQLAINKATFSSILTNPNPEIIQWRPSPEKWSWLEIACHLYDEECEDFRARIRSCFDAPDQPFKSIDPAGWMKSRNYGKQDYSSKVEAFLSSREESITWLRNLHDPNWMLGNDHQHFGRMSARMLLCNWLAHDYLHIRQLIRYQFLHLGGSVDIKLDYAGTW